MKEQQEEKKPGGGNESRNNNNNSINIDDDDSESLKGGDEEAYFDSFPPGFRFRPYDEELVVFYLKRKIMNEPLPRNRIKEVELYKFNPQTLSENWKSYGENEWYFFTPRDRKYKNGERPNRAAGDGYWKATGADKPVKFNGAEVGSRKALVFYKGKPPRGDKTDWIMHEFRVDNSPKRKREDNDMRLDDWVLCRLYKKVDKSARGSARSRDDSVPEEEQEDETQPQFDHDCGNMSVDEGSKMLVPQGNFIHEGLDSFDIYGDYYSQTNQMVLNGFDNNALYAQGSQSGFPRGPQSYYPQLGQTPEVIQHMFPGYQNPNLMAPVSFRPGEIHVKQERFTEYHSDELLNVQPDGNGFDQFSEFSGTSNSMAPPFFTDDKKIMENGLDRTVSDFRETSNSVFPPSINDNKKQNS